MDAKALMLVALGGAIGAVLRHLIGSWMPSESFPWGTLTVNLVGSFLLGCLACAATLNGLISEQMLMLLGVGLLGAFTTMSTFSVESVKMFEAGAWGPLSGYVLSTALLCPLLALGAWKVTNAVIGQP